MALTEIDLSKNAKDATLTPDKISINPADNFTFPNDVTATGMVESDTIKGRTGDLILQPFADSVSAIKLQNADGSFTFLEIDSSSVRSNMYADLYMLGSNIQLEDNHAVALNNTGNAYISYSSSDNAILMNSDPALADLIIISEGPITLKTKTNNDDINFDPNGTGSINAVASDFHIDDDFSLFLGHGTLKRDSVYGDAIIGETTPGAGTFELTSETGGYFQFSADRANGASASFAPGANADVIIAPTGTGVLNLVTKRITNVADPVDPQDVATKSYTQSIAAGLAPKEASRAGTTGPLPSVTYDNGLSGVGATLTADANGALPAQDGVTLLVGDRLLVKNQVSALENGVYDVTDAGSGGTPFILTRASDFDGSPANEVIGGSFTFVTEGTTQTGSGWVVVWPGTVIIGTDPINFTQFSSAGQFIAGNGIDISGNTISAEVDDVTINFLGSALQLKDGGITDVKVNAAAAIASTKLQAAGSNTQVQFNNSGTFGASANLVWDNSNSRLGIGITPTVTLDINGATRLGGTTSLGGQVTPTVTNTIDLGTASLRFRNLYAASGGSIYTGTMDGNVTGQGARIQSNGGMILGNAAGTTDSFIDWLADSSLNCFGFGVDVSDSTSFKLYYGSYTTSNGTPSGSNNFLRIPTSGQFQTIDGTAGAPQLSFISDPNTGIYRSGTDELSIATNGVQAFIVGASKVVSINPVGIGNPTPAVPLDVTGAIHTTTSLTADTSIITDLLVGRTGGVTVRPFSDTSTAFRIQNAAATTSILSLNLSSQTTWTFDSPNGQNNNVVFTGGGTSGGAGTVSITANQPQATGSLTLTGAAAGFGAGMTLTSVPSGTSCRAGGSITLTSGGRFSNGTFPGNGGSITLTSAQILENSVTGGAGGNITITSGGNDNGGGFTQSSTGNSGGITLTTGSVGVAGSQSGGSGNSTGITITTGQARFISGGPAYQSGNGGGITLSSGPVTGNGNPLVHGSGGSILLTAGGSGIGTSIGGAGGSITLTSGNGSGAGGGAGAGGSITLTTGTGGGSAPSGGNVTLTAGVATNGGNLYLTGDGLTHGQIGVGTLTPAASASVDITSTTRGFLPPRMTTTQRDAISSPATGLVIYNTTTNILNLYNGTSWTSVSPVINFATREVPSGLINSSNTVFTLANTPTVGSEEVYLNGLLQNVGVGNDYTISGATITFTNAPITGSVLLVTYRY